MRGKTILAAAAAFAAAGVGLTAALLTRPADSAKVSVSVPGTAAVQAFVQQANGWIQQRQETQTVRLAMSDVQNGWRTDGKALYQTTDGGIHWTQTGRFYDGGTASFVDAANAFALAKPVKDELSFSGISLYATADAGQSWRHTAFSGAPLFRTDTLVRGIDGFSMATSRSGLLLLAGDAAAGSHDVSVYATADGGRTFSLRGDTLRLPTGNVTLRLSNAKHAFLFVNAAAAAAQLYTSADGGASWNQTQNLPSTRYVDVTPMLYPVRLDDTARVVMLESQNGLENYPVAKGGTKHEGPDTKMRAVFSVLNETGRAQSTLTTLLTTLPLDERSVSMPDTNHLYVYTQEQDKGVLLRFTAGSGWTRVAAAGLPSDARQVQFVSASDGFLLEDTALYTTTDGGKNWAKHSF